MRKLKRTILLLVVGALSCLSSMAQGDFSVKTNLLTDALLSPNIAVEAGVSPKWSVALEGEINAWTLSGGKRWKHWFVVPQARYWLCDRFGGHFFGAQVFGGQYNVGFINLGFKFPLTPSLHLGDNRFQGWFVGSGVSYGYAWELSKHLNLEAEIGFGWAYSRYDQFPCAVCGNKIVSNKRHIYGGPTKAALNLVYVF